MRTLTLIMDDGSTFNVRLLDEDGNSLLAQNDKLLYKIDMGILLPGTLWEADLYWINRSTMQKQEYRDLSFEDYPTEAFEVERVYLKTKA